MIKVTRWAKREQAELMAEYRLAAERLKECFSAWVKEHKNPVDFAMWYGRYVALDRLFGLQLVDEAILSRMHAIVLDLRQGLWEQYRAVS